MKYRTSIGIPVAIVLALVFMTPDSGHAQHRQGADRMHQLDRDRNFDRDRDRSLDRDLDRGRDRDRADIRERPRDWDRLSRRDPSGMKDQDIYGHEYMTPEERQQYRERLGNIATSELRQKFQAEHEELMQMRALVKGGDLVPPGQAPIYGGELMTVQERNKYREQLRRLKAGKERQQFLSRHRDLVDERARALGYKIKEAK